MNDKHLSRTALASLLLAACGSVVEPDGADPIDPAVASTDELAVDGRADQPGPATPAPSPILVEAPRPATTERSLFTMSFATNAPIIDVVRAEARARVDVLEQRIVTRTDDEVQLAITLPTPTGTYARTIVSDVGERSTSTEHVLCEMNGFATFDPRCETAKPTSRALPATGPIVASQWHLWVLDEATGTELTGCDRPGPGQLTCVLPGRALAGYRIIASAHGFADLWDGTPNLGQFVYLGRPFTGAFLPQRAYECWDWRVSGGSMWCTVRHEYVRFQGLDQARLDFDPITVELTADHSVTTMASPAMVWDAGDADLPGAH